MEPNNIQNLNNPMGIPSSMPPKPQKKWGRLVLIALLLLVVIAVIGWIFRWKEGPLLKNGFMTYSECVAYNKIPCKHYFMGDFKQEWSPSPYMTKEECDMNERIVGATCVVPEGSFRETRWISSADLERAKNQNTGRDNQNKADWKTYTNSRYGFELTLTDAWKGYKVFSSEGSQGVGAPTYLQFAMPTSDKTKCVMSVTDEICGYVAPFTIIIIAKGREVSTVDGKITEDENYNYYYSLYTHFNDLPTDLSKINFEIPKAISTFKFNK